MTDRARLLAAPRSPSGPAFALAIACSLLVALVAGGCGRSGIDDDFPVTGADASVDSSVRPDGGMTPDARADSATDGGGSCTATSCPTGCCAGDVCQDGATDAVCGGFGSTCSDCKAQGFDRCDTATKRCVKDTPGGCSPANCGGCCETVNGVAQCLTGRDPSACGFGGNACTQCVNQGLTCDTTTRQCVKGATCSPLTCAGCCDGDVCLTGGQTQACGKGGAQCTDCSTTKQQCQTSGGLTGGSCESPTPACNATNCTGCCVGSTCLVGTQPQACGTAGQLCATCGATGSCLPVGGNKGGVCQGPPPPVCGPANCNGCCQNNVCVAGTATDACGTKGEQCQTCATGGTCAPVGTGVGQGGTCQTPPPPPCGPTTCTGCCFNGLCAVGSQDTACGTNGGTCSDCSRSTRVCTAGACATPPPPPCGPQNCAGCCDATGTCQAGFLNGECGSQGLACTNCTARQSTCDTNATPRACRTATSTCPSTYGTCGAAVTTRAPVRQQVCSAATLSNGRAACSGGPDTPACIAFFQFLTGASAACSACLAPFDVAFNEGSGIFACLAPFVSSTCNRATGCTSDCQDKSCASCSASQVEPCQTEARTTQCQQYWQQSSCVTSAFFGSGAVCNPLSYGGNYGQWLQGVGNRYCGL